MKPLLKCIPLNEVHKNGFYFGDAHEKNNMSRAWIHSKLQTVLNE